MALLRTITSAVSHRGERVVTTECSGMIIACMLRSDNSMLRSDNSMFRSDNRVLGMIIVCSGVTTICSGVTTECSVKACARNYLFWGRMLETSAIAYVQRLMAYVISNRP